MDFESVLLRRKLLDFLPLEPDSLRPSGVVDEDERLPNKPFNIACGCRLSMLLRNYVGQEVIRAKLPEQTRRSRSCGVFVALFFFIQENGMWCIIMYLNRSIGMGYAGEEWIMRSR